MKKKILLAASALLFFGCSINPKTVAAPPNPEPAKSSPESKPISSKKFELPNKLKSFSCKRGQEIRSVWTETIEPQGCKLWYSNNSKRGPTAWSRVGNSHCLNVGEQIIKKLENAGYNCVLE